MAHRNNSQWNHPYGLRDIPVARIFRPCRFLDKRCPLFWAKKNKPSFPLELCSRDSVKSIWTPCKNVMVFMQKFPRNSGNESSQKQGTRYYNSFPKAQKKKLWNSKVSENVLIVKASGARYVSVDRSIQQDEKILQWKRKICIGNAEFNHQLTLDHSLMQVKQKAWSQLSGFPISWLVKSTKQMGHWRRPLFPTFSFPPSGSFSPASLAILGTCFVGERLPVCLSMFRGYWG